MFAAHDRYYDGDRDKLFAEANCVNPSNAAEQSDKAVQGPKADICCDICFTDFPAEVCASVQVVWRLPLYLFLSQQRRAFAGLLRLLHNNTSNPSISTSACMFELITSTMNRPRPIWTLLRFSNCAKCLAAMRSVRDAGYCTSRSRLWSRAQQYVSTHASPLASPAARLRVLARIRHHLCPHFDYDVMLHVPQYTISALTLITTSYCMCPNRQ